MTDGDQSEQSEDEIEIIDVNQLVRSVEACEGRVAFLIGAGTSEPADIPTSGELIERWKEERYTDENPDVEEYNESDIKEWAEQKEPDGDDLNEYGFWFEEVYRSPGARKEFIQSTVEDGEPTVGIVVLASMMNDGYIPLTLTPNFDDLLYDAFYRYLEDKPLLVDHDAIAPQFRLTEDRPTIIKLHGDYLYDNLQNTADETSELEENMKEVLRRSMNEYGLVVVGYGGRDDSIMDVLMNEEIPNQGLYWCSRSTDPEEMSEKTRKVLQKENAFLVEIDGSEDLFLEFARKLEVYVPTRQELMERAEERAESLSELRKERKEETSDEEEEEFLEVSEMKDRAYEHLQNDEWKKALELYNRIIETGPAGVVEYNNRGNARRRLGEYENAVEDYNRAIEIDPELSVPYNNRGFARVELDEYEDAIEDFNRAIELNPEYSEAYNNRGNARKNLGEYENAVEDYNRAIEIDPEYSEAYNNRGIARRRLGEYEDAVEDFNRAIEIDPENSYAYRNRAELYIELGEHDDALNDAQTTLGLSDNTDKEAQSLMLLLIAKILLDEDISDEEEEYRELCAGEFETTWSFKELDEWLEDADIDNDKEEKIREIIDLLREHKPD